MQVDLYIIYLSIFFFFCFWGCLSFINFLLFVCGDVYRRCVLRHLRDGTLVQEIFEKRRFFNSFAFFPFHGSVHVHATILRQQQQQQLYSLVLVAALFILSFWVNI